MTGPRNARRLWSSPQRLAGAALVVCLATAVAVLAATRDDGTRRGPAPAASTGAARGETFSLLATADVSAVPTDPDARSVELGLRFTSRVDGTVDAVRFLRAPGDRTAHPVTVWNDRGDKLATAVSAAGAREGWDEVALPEPVRVEAGAEYVVSYRTDYYRSTGNYFTSAVRSGPLSTVGAAGVYAYGDGVFPDQTTKASNYWVDVVFSSAAVPGATGAPDLPLVAWEGGPAFYARHSKAAGAGWTDPAFFPIAVWYEGTYTQAEIDLDKAAGLNTYIELAEDSNLPLIRRNGMAAMISGKLPGYGAETTGWLLADEVDMWGGAGKGRWTGKWPGEGEICDPVGTGCGHDVQKRVDALLPRGDGRLRHANYGKGVVFWQPEQEAAAFVNGYTSVVSSDIYWYTDPNVCASASEGPALGVPPERCRRAANYGLVIDRMRKLDARDGKRQPVYAFVEVGHPFKEDAAPTITGDQVAGAVMSSLIHEARGVIYFNHSFGGACESQHVLRDCGRNTTRPKVTQVNERIRALAPVLNTQSSQWMFNADLDTMLKVHGDDLYVFAMPGRDGGTGTQRLTLPGTATGARAEVLFENRTVPIVDGVIEDRFASEHSYHIYKIKN